MDDLFDRIFLRLCIHASVTLGIHLLWLFLVRNVGLDSPYDTLWILILVANCTALILGKLNRILKRLPGGEK